MSDMPNRATRRALAAQGTAATVAPIDAAAEALAGGAITDPPIPPSEIVPVPMTGAAPDSVEVLPDPSIVARPDGPRPLVTASPPLAAEPDALDVAEAARAAGDAMIGDAANARPDRAIAGQTMLAVERYTKRVADDTARHDRDALREGTFGQLAGTSDQAASTGTLFAGTGVDARSAGGIDYRGEPVRPEQGDRVTVIEVVGPPQGRRRAGFAFGPEPRRFLATQLTDQQLAAIRGDRLLTVGVSDMPAETFAGASLGEREFNRDA